ncbi:MAG TPA: hypothetical protein VER96_24435 [Polyangiaceae bacterium]|nr:hypothetical protein [Polyangiaceae bacterium]
MKLGTSCLVVVGSCLLLASACSGNSDGSNVNSGNNGSGATGNTGTGAGNSAGISLNVGTGNNTGSDSDAGPGTGGGTDLCNGATLGVKGTWGAGDVFASWLSSRSNSGATALADQTLTPTLLSSFQVIIVEDVSHNHPYSADEVKALSDWVGKGGGLMTLIGYSANSTEVDNVNRLLAPFSISYGTDHILPKGAGNSTVPITMWNPHAIDAGVTAVGVDNGYPLMGMGDVIATGGGYNLGLAQTSGSGHVFAWADEWITYNSEWNSHPDYQVQTFWVNAVKWLTVATQCQVSPPPNPPK